MDLGSKNGVRIDGNLVMRAPLRPGDTFRCGKVFFEFSGEAMLPDEAPTRIGPAAFGPPPGAPAPGTSKGPRAERRPDDEITTEIPDVGSRKTLFIALGRLGGLAAAAVIAAVMLGG